MKGGSDMNERNSGFSPAEVAADLSLRDMVTPLFRRKRVLIATFLAVLALVILLAAFKGPSFASRMTILVNRERLDPLMTPESTTQMITNSTPITEEEINSEVELLSSRDVLEKVAIANGLDLPAKGWSLGSLIHPNQTREDRLARAVKNLASAIKIEAVTKTNLIEVKYSSPDPERSYGVLKSLGEFYTQKHVEVHRPAGSYEFFAGETQRYHDALEKSEANLRDLASRSGVAAPDEQRTNLALQVGTSIGLLHLAEQSLAGDEERMANDALQMEKTPPRSPTVQTSATADKLLDALNASLLAAQTKRTQLMVKYEPTYPLVQGVDQEIAQTKAMIAQAQATRYVTDSTDLDRTFEALREDRAKTEADRATQLATVKATRQSIKSMQAQLIDLDQESIQRQDLLREVKANEQNYLLYLAKREQERTSDALDTTRIANVAIAVPPSIPVLPVVSWPLALLIGFCSAIVLSVGSAYAADYFDSSFQDPAQVADTLGIPVVVAFPKRTA
jgi:uncharacterized protein involved in exopolysaccharide biosynthesis